MKAVIDGKLYDTDKAEVVGSYDSPHYRNDFHWYEETLYRTKAGNYFLLGEGNGLSPYSERCADGSGSGSAIRPIRETEALEWCEEHGVEAEEICEHFSGLVQEA